MTRKHSAPQPPLPNFRTRKGSGAVVLQGVDGRSLMARRFREIICALESDMGCDPSEAQRHIMQRAATMAVWMEAREIELAEGGEFDAQGYATVANAQRRLLADLGLERRQRNVTPTLSDFMAARGSGQ